MTRMPFLREATTAAVIAAPLFPATLNLECFGDGGGGSSAGSGSDGVGQGAAHSRGCFFRRMVT